MSPGSDLFAQLSTVLVLFSSPAVPAKVLNVSLSDLLGLHAHL